MISTPLINTSSPPPPFSASNIHGDVPAANRIFFLIDKAKTVKELLQIQSLVFRLGIQSNPVVNFKLQRSYSSLGRHEYASSIFCSIPNPNVYLWTDMIRSHANRGLRDEAIEYYIQMVTSGIQPNSYSLSSALEACPLEQGKCLHCQAIKLDIDSSAYVRSSLLQTYSRGGDLVSARKLFDRMDEKGIITCTAMVTGYCKNGNLEEARILFDGLKEKDMVCWNAMIDGYNRHGKPREAYLLLEEILDMGLKLDYVTVLSMLSTCKQLGLLESGRWLHSYMKNNGIEINLRLASALIDMYSKCASLEDARSVFDSIDNKDAIVWNSMIFGYAMHGLTDKALELFGEMSRRGYRPIDTTFIAILNGCVNKGLISEAWQFFNSMEDRYGIKRKVEHYSCMVNLLCRAGKLQEAFDFVKEMELQQEGTIWAALLRACKLHGDMKLAESISDFVLCNNYANTGNYILLYNAYAMVNNQVSMAKVRTLMNRTGFKFIRSSSSIEVNNEVHDFVSGIMDHPRKEEICMKIEEMNNLVESYCSSSSDQMVDTLRFAEVHGEKFALAFGLLTTESGSELKIVNSHRVCADCHAFVKILSKLTERKIVVRDGNHFHYFVNGSCSCGDRW